MADTQNCIKARLFANGAKGVKEVSGVCATAAKSRKKKVGITIDGMNAASEMLKRWEFDTDHHFITMGQFSLMEFLAALIDRMKGPVDLHLMTWSAHEADLRDAYALLENGKLGKLRMIVDRSFPGRQPEYYAELLRLKGEQSVVLARCHAKGGVLVGADGQTLTINTSMNLNRNARWESGVVSSCHDVATMWLNAFDLAEQSANAEQATLAIF